MATRVGTARKQDRRVIGLTILLLKEGATSENVLAPDPEGDVRSCAVRLGETEVGVLAYKQNPEHAPPWLRFFAETADLRRRNLRNASVSAVFLTRSSGRLFALSFGHGRHLLESDLIEERFGLRVTLNSVDADELRSVDVTTLEANPMHGKRQPSKAAPLGEFGLNLDQDILRGVTGKPIDENLGTRMTGADSLAMRVRADLRSLTKLLGKYLAKSKETTYQERFAWVDHIAEVRDSPTRQRLFVEFLKQMRSNASHVWAAIPAVVDWSTFDYFRFGTLGSSVKYDDVTLDRVLDVLGDETLDVLKRKRVYCVAKGNPYPVMEWTFLNCLNAEIALDQSRYLLNAGSWYKVDADFASKILADVSAIPKASLTLDDWGDETEAEYNIRVAGKSKGQLCLMDRVMVMYRGMPSPIEFCDLYSSSGAMIHVKRYGQSSVLSHLFAQGTVAAESALADADFRRAVNEKLPGSHRFGDPEIRIDPAKHEVCFAIGSSEPGPLKLPFFSQVTLRNAYRRLRHSLGYNVTLAKIRVSKLTDITGRRPADVAPAHSIVRLGRQPGRESDQ